jgi:hypothetical protein
MMLKSTVQGYAQLITIKNLKASPLQKLTLMDQFPISEDKSILINMISPNKDAMINIAEQTSTASATSLYKGGSIRGSIYEKAEKEKDRILWNPDTGKVIWDFIDVKQKKTLEIKLEWEVICGDRIVHSHFGDKI